MSVVTRNSNVFFLLIICNFDVRKHNLEYKINLKKPYEKIKK